MVFSEFTVISIVGLSFLDALPLALSDGDPQLEDGDSAEECFRDEHFDQDWPEWRRLYQPGRSLHH